MARAYVQTQDTDGEKTDFYITSIPDRDKAEAKTLIDKAETLSQQKTPAERRIDIRNDTAGCYAGSIQISYKEYLSNYIFSIEERSKELNELNEQREQAESALASL